MPAAKTAAALSMAIERRSRRIVVRPVNSAVLPIRDFLQRRLERLGPQTAVGPFHPRSDRPVTLVRCPALGPIHVDG